MKSKNRAIEIFNLSMLDVLTGALGAFLLIMLILMRFHNPTLIKENADLREQMQAASTKLADALRQTESQAQNLQEAQRRLEEARSDLAKAASVAQELEERLGISLKASEIVFVIDVSGSMRLNNPDKEDRISQVISGVKMLVATMSSRYSIDVVSFPGRNGPADAMFGRLQPVTDSLKYDVYRRLQALPVGGGTPTGDAMRIALGPTYDAAKTVVLLSDGEPCRTSGDSCIALSRAETATLVQELSQLNGGRKTINTIGVGSSFRNEAASTVDAVTFLRSLADSNGGFYIGF
jgi:Mg-chelatase subunit ChlD